MNADDPLVARLTRLYDEAGPEDRAVLTALFELAATAAVDADDEVVGHQWTGPGLHTGALGGGGDPGADLAMIRIQSIVSQRQQAMQLASQMLGSTNDTTKSIIDHIHP